MIIEAYYFLDLPSDNLIDEEIVKKSYKEKALEYHPNSSNVINMNSEDKELAKLQWLLLSKAYEVALNYVMHKENFTKKCREKVRNGYDPNKKEFVTFSKLNDSLHQAENSTAEKKLILTHDETESNTKLVGVVQSKGASNSSDGVRLYKDQVYYQN